MLVEKINPSGYIAISSNANDTGLRAVTVTVTSPTGKTTTAQVYRSNVGGTQQPISTDATFVTWVGCTLKLGTNTPSTTGVSLSNHAEDQ